jgi:hypothetical protein
MWKIIVLNEKKNSLNHFHILLWMKMSNLFIYLFLILCQFLYVRVLNHANLASILGSSWGHLGYQKKGLGVPHEE